eukprot:TRINITY_DN1148_c0_g1_i2.p1 TRINITY_DN1148_c0_g1~~TRINITY_DN1148_c0_g1_i2.p1  ORF type:complete len:215 (+),score=46.94 TRINITY_DN1148_c0_g1_i2:317-961(+)
MAPTASAPAITPISKVKRLQSGEGSTHCFLTKESVHDFGDLNLGLDTHPGKEHHYYLTQRKNIKDRSGQGAQLFERLYTQGAEVEDSWEIAEPKPLRPLRDGEGSQHSFITKESEWQLNPATGEYEEIQGTARYYYTHEKRIKDDTRHGDAVFNYEVTHGHPLEEDVVISQQGAIDLLHGGLPIPHRPAGVHYHPRQPPPFMVHGPQMPLAMYH